MSNRYKVILAIGIALLLIGSIFTSDVLPILSDEIRSFSEDIAIHIVIDNRTNQQIEPFVISVDRDISPLRTNKIEPLSKLDVYYLISSHRGGESQITMTDSNGEKYLVVPYFELEQKGRVDIRIECASPNGLSGKKREWLSWDLLPSAWNSWGTSACKARTDD